MPNFIGGDIGCGIITYSVGNKKINLKSIDKSPNTLNLDAQIESKFVGLYYNDLCDKKNLDVEVKYINKVMGKGVFAKKDFKLLSNVFEELPLISQIMIVNLENLIFFNFNFVLNVEIKENEEEKNRIKYECCSYCMKFFYEESDMPKKFQKFYKEIYPKGKPQLIPCDHCNIDIPKEKKKKNQEDDYFRPKMLLEKYCSKECKEEAWEKYHKILCMRDFISTKEAVHPLIHLYHLCKTTKRTNPIFIAKIFANVKLRIDSGFFFFDSTIFF